MKISEVVKKLNLDKDFVDTLQKAWELSESLFPLNGPPFLKRNEYRKDFAWSGLDNSILPVLDEQASKIAGNPALCHLAWHCYNTLYYYENPSFHQWPLWENILGKNRGVVYLLVALAMIPLVKNKFCSMSIPERIAIDTCKAIKGACEIYKTANGSIGVNPRTLYWLRNYTEGKIFRIGRFEYMHCKRNDVDIEVYKNKQTGKILALAGNETYFSKDGFIVYPDEDKAKAAFVSTLVHEEDFVTGVPLDPVTGTAVNTLVKLDLNDWETNFATGDMILDLHIPAGGKMTLDDCKESFVNALEFYRKYFSEIKISAIISTSWIFYNYYEKALPESNLAAFMKELYLFPFPSGGRDGIYFIFGKDDGDISGYPQDNTIRKTMVDVFKSGGRLRRGGMFFLPEHIDMFGQQAYRTKLKTDIIEELLC